MIQGAASMRNGVAIIERTDTERNREYPSASSSAPSRPARARMNENSPTCERTSPARIAARAESPNALAAAQTTAAFSATTAAVSPSVVAGSAAHAPTSTSMPIETKKRLERRSRSGTTSDITWLA